MIPIALFSKCWISLEPFTICSPSQEILSIIWNVVPLQREISRWWCHPIPGMLPHPCFWLTHAFSSVPSNPPWLTPSFDDITPIPTNKNDSTLLTFLNYLTSFKPHPNRTAHEVEDLFKKLTSAYWVLALNMCVRHPTASLRYTQSLLNILGQMKDNDVDIANALLCKKLALRKMGGDGSIGWACD